MATRRIAWTAPRPFSTVDELMRTPVQTPDLSAFDRPSRALNILSALAPPLGLIFYLVLVGKLPHQAVSAGTSAIKGVKFYAFILVILIVFSLIGWFVSDVLGWGNPPDVPSSTATARPPQF